MVPFSFLPQRSKGRREFFMMSTLRSSTLCVNKNDQFIN